MLEWIRPCGWWIAGNAGTKATTVAVVFDSDAQSHYLAVFVSAAEAIISCPTYSQLTLDSLKVQRPRQCQTTFRVLVLGMQGEMPVENVCPPVPSSHFCRLLYHRRD